MIEVSRAYEITQSVVTDEDERIREALRNLVDNALRHGGPDLTYVDVDAARRSDKVVITVQDDGVGMSQEALAAARERFRIVAPTSRSGLGVSIVEAVAQGHGGALELTFGDPGIKAVLHFPV